MISLPLWVRLPNLHAKFVIRAPEADQPKRSFQLPASFTNRSFNMTSDQIGSSAACEWVPYNLIKPKPLWSRLVHAFIECGQQQVRAPDMQIRVVDINMCQSTWSTTLTTGWGNLWSNPISKKPCGRTIESQIPTMNTATYYIPTWMKLFVRLVLFVIAPTEEERNNDDRY